MQGMPREAIYAMAGIIGFMVVFGFFMMRRSFKKAGQKTQAIQSGLRDIGLEMVKQDGAKTRSQGTYKGLPAVLETDASALMKVGMGAWGVGLAAEFVSPAWSSDTNEKINRKLERMAKSGMQSAPIMLRFGISLPGPLGTAEIRREPFSDGTDLGSGLFARGDVTGIQRPAILEALGQVEFDVVTVERDQVTLIWTPPNREYQQHMAKDGFVGIADKTFSALASFAS
jgi:hypothetical protein